MSTLFARIRKRHGDEKKQTASGRMTLLEIFSGHRQREVKGIAWWALSLLLAAAVWPHPAGQNALGPMGEVIFRLGFGCLGVMVYSLPVIAALYGVLVFKDTPIEHKSYKLLGLVLAMLAFGILVELLHPEAISLDMVKSFYAGESARAFWENVPRDWRWWGAVSLPAGGVIANASANLLTAIFSLVGTYIVCATIFILSLYFLEVERHAARTVHAMAQSLRQLFLGRSEPSQFGYAPKSPAPAPKAEPELIKPAWTAKPKIKITSPSLPLNAKLVKESPPAVTEAPEMGVDGEQKPFQLPGLELLESPRINPALSAAYFENMSHTLENALGQFGVAAKVVEVCPGPVVTRYELQPSPGVKVNRIISLADDIALAMRAEHVRIEAPIPGKGAVGIELPNQEKEIVVMQELLAAEEFKHSASILTFAVGKDIGGKHVFAQLDSMPHLLIAGATGSGKSACINAIISSLLFRATPREVRLLMIDPKRVELTMYNGIPHLKSPVITDSREAAVALKMMVREMEQRYQSFAELGVRDIHAYNRRAAASLAADAGEEGAAKVHLSPMPFIVIFIDELADLMLVSANEVEGTITRLAQMARGVGIHMVLATQRPSVDVITGVIKANFPSRIAFQVSSKVDSRTILDANGADALLGRGDMLYAPASATKPLRVQGVFITTSEVEKLAGYWRRQGKPVFDTAFSKEKLAAASEGGNGQAEEDDLYPQAVEWVVRAKQASTSMLQRRLKVGYSRAARLLDMMEERGVVGPPEGSKPRKVLIPVDGLSPLNAEEQEDEA